MVRDHDLEFVQTVLYFSSQILARTDTRRLQTQESLAFTLFPRKVDRYLDNSRYGGYL